jgi:hypothetical protein
LFLEADNDIFNQIVQCIPDPLVGKILNAKQKTEYKLKNVGARWDIHFIKIID